MVIRTVPLHVTSMGDVGRQEHLPVVLEVPLGSTCLVHELLLFSFFVFSAFHAHMSNVSLHSSISS